NGSLQSVCQIFNSVIIIILSEMPDASQLLLIYTLPWQNTSICIHETVKIPLPPVSEIQFVKSHLQNTPSLVISIFDRVFFIE
ncbi:MAG: hypothetical protein IKB71_04565, partial [Lentisphaeria bacterium]|nr:hypothetical protein [Lentisphaeria bacterium]